jgi:23S rRNA pseudouridine955/2504/2580 synthase
MVIDIIESNRSEASVQRSKGPAAQVQLVAVDENSEGQRLDNFLIRQLKGVPKSHIYQLIRSGQVRVNKVRASAETKLKISDRVRIPPVRVASPTQHVFAKAALTPEKVTEFPIIFEDDALLVIDKPAGLAVHGGSGVSFGVIEQLRKLRPEETFLELVHRLDRETSGLLMIAKKRSALKHLQEQLKARETGKTYLALVAGQWPLKQKVLDKPLMKFQTGDEETGERRVRVVSKNDPEGMRAISLVKVRARSGDNTTSNRIRPTSVQQALDCSVLEVTIKTGRTHQIRVHLASEGHPILGDDKYGDFGLNKDLAKLGLKRMFLHAWRLQFDHPVTAQRAALIAPLPDELHHFLVYACPSAI